MLTARIPGALAAALFSDNVPEEVYRNLINSVHKNIKPLHKYVKLRGRALGINKMKMYDLAVPIVGDCRREYSWEETVKTVKQALAPLGGEYGETLNRAFTERWVDILPCRGKRTGAYSSGCFDTYPYLLLNFTGTLNCYSLWRTNWGTPCIHSTPTHPSRTTTPITAYSWLRSPVPPTRYCCSII